MNDGRMIRELIHHQVTPGEHEIEIDLSGLPGGLYFVRSQINNHISTHKLIVLKH
jgi:hypothetical protein